MEIKQTFWNYIGFPYYGDKTNGEGDSIWKHYTLSEIVADWHKLGFNYPMSFVYDGKSKSDVKTGEKYQDPSDVIALLDECGKYGMKVILSDRRVNMKTLAEVGEERFREGVKKSLSEFGSHSAVYAYYIGDEPGSIEALDNAAKTSRIVKEYAPNVETYLNHLPVALDPNIQISDSYMLAGGYEKYVDDAKTGILGYDNYAAMAVYNKEKFIDDWFANLRILGEAARRKGVELFCCPNSMSFDCIRVPSEDDARWLISAHVASGATGLAWFQLYQNSWDTGTWYGAPYDTHFERTPTFDVLKRQIRLFTENQGAVLKNYDFVWAKHFNKSYGGFEPFNGDDGFSEIKCEVNEVPLVITKLRHKEGYYGYAITNISQTERTLVKATFIGEDGKPVTLKKWLMPGQMTLQLKGPWLF